MAVCDKAQLAATRRLCAAERGTCQVPEAEFRFPASQRPRSAAQSLRVAANRYPGLPRPLLAALPYLFRSNDH